MIDNKILQRKRFKYIGGKFRPVEISQRRLERRKAVFEITSRKDITWISKIDMIIDYFQKLYEGERYKGFTKEERRKLFIEKGGVCMWCKIPMKYESYTIEHIIPLVEGGTDDWDNLGIAHEKCNNGRDGNLITSNGYLIEALKKYNPTVKFLLNSYPQVSIDHDHD